MARHRPDRPTRTPANERAKLCREIAKGIENHLKAEPPVTSPPPRPTTDAVKDWTIR